MRTATILLLILLVGITPVHADVNYGFTIGNHTVRVIGNRLFVDQKTALVKGFVDQKTGLVEGQTVKLSAPGLAVEMRPDGYFSVEYKGSQVVISRQPTDTPRYLGDSQSLVKLSNFWSSTSIGKGRSGVFVIDQISKASSYSPEFLEVVKTFRDHGDPLIPWTTPRPTSPMSYQFKFDGHTVRVQCRGKDDVLIVDGQRKTLNADSPATDGFSLPGKAFVFLESKTRVLMIMWHDEKHPYDLSISVYAKDTPLFGVNVEKTTINDDTFWDYECRLAGKDYVYEIEQGNKVKRIPVEFQSVVNTFKEDK